MPVPLSPNSPEFFSEAAFTLLEATSGKTGYGFFESLTVSLATYFGAEHAFVGQLCEGGQAIQTLAYVCRGKIAPNFQYGLDHTPCEGVIADAVCYYPQSVAALFPKDEMLAQMGIEAYAGIPVTNTEGSCLGILVVLDQKSLADPRGIESILRLFGMRAAAEIERDRHHQMLAAQNAENLRLQKVLAVSEARYKLMVTSCSEGIWVIDTAGVTLFVNTQLTRMVGCAVEDMMGRPFFDFMDDRARCEAEVNMERRSRGIAEAHEFRLKHRDGRDIWVIMATNPLYDEAGTFIGSQAFVTDVTERRGLELKIQHAQKLESLGVLAGGIAHDFNNLLVGILGNVGLAKREVPREASIVPLLSDIETAALRAADLTKQMLAYSGKGRFVVEHIDVNRVVEEMAHLLTTVVSKKAVLKFNLTRDLPAIEADATQVRQIVMNLITNASDAIGERSGVISITTGIVDVDHNYLGTTYLDEGLREGDYVYVEISDTGAGMDASTQLRIFDPFFTTKFTGRGLGLAAVLGILRGHRGAIKVYSEVGRGSTFKVLLPAAKGATREAATVRRPGVDAFSGTGTILVCDDEATIRTIARRVCERSGFKVITAADGREGVTLFRENMSDIIAVILDMTMPGLNGKDAFSEMRRLKPDVKVILSSGYNEQDATTQFVGKGLAGFLPKPWSPDDLLAALNTALTSAPRRD